MAQPAKKAQPAQPAAPAAAPVKRSAVAKKNIMKRTVYDAAKAEAATAAQVQQEENVHIDDLIAFMNKHLLSTDTDMIDTHGRRILLTAGKKPPLNKEQVRAAGLTYVKGVHRDCMIDKWEQGQVNAGDITDADDLETYIAARQ